MSRRVAAAVIASLAIATPVTAAPKGSEAKAAFTKGLAAYKKGAFDSASEALAKSFALEADPDTLFAWAQSERQRGKCDKAIELFEKLLAYELPAENKQAIREKVAECKAILGAQKPVPVEPPPAPPAESAPPEEPAPAVSTPEPAPQNETPERRAWWKDPVGGVLIGAGVVGLGVGGYFMLSARGAESDAEAATNYFDFEEHTRRAEAHGRNGVIAALAGGALVGAGIVWYATRDSPSSEGTTVSTWLAPSGGGLVARTRF
jgi:tetratricopeptide (TPR) repeat protein